MAYTSQHPMCTNKVSWESDIFCDMFKKEYNIDFLLFTHDTKNVS